jgi:hypothetical protein
VFRLPLEVLLNKRNHFSGPLRPTEPFFQDGEHEMHTEEETRTYNQAKDVKNNTAACVTCRKTVPMTIEYSIGFGMYQCYECGEKENIFLKKIKR